MDPADDLRGAGARGRLHHLQHELRTPLTTILGRAYLLGRAIRRAPSLSDEERARMLTGVAAIETAVAAMGAVIAGMDDEYGRGADDGPANPP